MQEERGREEQGNAGDQGSPGSTEPLQLQGAGFPAGFTDPGCRAGAVPWPHAGDERRVCAGGQPRQWGAGCGAAGASMWLQLQGRWCGWCAGALERLRFPPRPSPALAAFRHQKPRFLLLLLAGNPSSWIGERWGEACPAAGGTPAQAPREPGRAFSSEVVQRATLPVVTRKTHQESWISLYYGMASPSPVPSAVQRQQPSLVAAGVRHRGSFPSQHWPPANFPKPFPMCKGLATEPAAGQGCLEVPRCLRERLEGKEHVRGLPGHSDGLWGQPRSGGRSHLQR